MFEDEARTYGGRVAAVEPGSIAEEIGMEPGDVLASINGHPLRDVIDYQFYGAEEELVLEVVRNGEVHRIDVEREYDEVLGLTFTGPLFDGLLQCENRCPFCFVAQMPRGMRRTLYVRDDDYRLSFLLGSYITLTNLDEDDWYRIGEQHLSPLYVSVHASEVERRRTLLGNPQAPDIIEQLHRLERMNITVHAQIVIVPGSNDGAVLEETIGTLLDLWPAVQTLALVPVGLTRHCNEDIRLMNASDAQAVLDIAAAWAPRARARTSRTWLFPSDELYLVAGQPVPPSEHYDDPAQIENGVGLVRALLDDWAFTREELEEGMFSGMSATLVCGELIAPTLRQLAHDADQLTGAQLTVVPVVNAFFGSSVTVSGLLTGADVLSALQDMSLGDVVCIPRAMLDESGERTLDDLSVDALAEALGIPVEPVASISDMMDMLYSIKI